MSKPDLQFAGIARTPGEVVCASGMRMIADYCIDDPPDPLIDLIVTGGRGWVDVAKDEKTLHFVRATPSRVTAICTGAMILAAAGILEGKRATTKREVFSGETSPLTILSWRSDTQDAAISEKGPGGAWSVFFTMSSEIRLDEYSHWKNYKKAFPNHVWRMAASMLHGG